MFLKGKIFPGLLFVMSRKCFTVHIPTLSIAQKQLQTNAGKCNVQQCNIMEFCEGYCYLTWSEISDWQKLIWHELKNYLCTLIIIGGNVSLILLKHIKPHNKYIIMYFELPLSDSWLDAAKKIYSANHAMLSKLSSSLNCHVQTF